MMLFWFFHYVLGHGAEYIGAYSCSLMELFDVSMEPMYESRALASIGNEAEDHRPRGQCRHTREVSRSDSAVPFFDNGQSP